MITNELTYEEDRDYLNESSHTFIAFNNTFMKKEPGDPIGRDAIACITAEFSEDEFRILDQIILDFLRYNRTNNVAHSAHAFTLLKQLAYKVEFTWARQFTDDIFPQHYSP